MSKSFFYRALIISAISASANYSLAEDFASAQIGSQAELWMRRDLSEKAAYLDGMCEGLNAAQHLSGELMCAPMAMQVANPAAAKQHPGFRLCGKRWPDMHVGQKGEPNGIDILDAYYQKPEHSDVPVDP